MAESSPLIDFENFPRQPLSFPVTRRQILSTISRELIVRSEREGGMTTPRLSDLGVLPDEQLRTLIPLIIPDTKIMVKEGFIWGKPPKALRDRKLIPYPSPAVTTYNQFNGLRTLQAASEALARELEWEPAKAFAYTRGVFLWLVWNGVCRPLRDS